MNVIFPFSWIKDHLKASVDIQTVAKLVTSIGPTVEEIKKENDDYLLNIEVTINRPDCLSILGIAREMYVALKQNGYQAKLENDYLSNWVKIPISSKKIPLDFEVDSKLTPRFTAILLKNVQVKPAPKIIQERLIKSGIRTLNNIIDITNYLMLELGQPNHAFDFDKITGPKFIVRSAKKGEKVTTLDQQVRKLDQGDNIIQDSSGRIIDLCGIMGGKLSEVDQSTKNILWLVANDYFAQIRKTCMRMGIQTEASARLTKELNPEVTYPTLLRGVELMIKHANAQVDSKIIDLYPQKQKIPTIAVSDEFIAQKIGQPIAAKTTGEILQNLGFKVKRINNLVKVKPPIWRINDVCLPEDIVEEVTRVNGYDKITNQPLTFPLPPKPKQFVKSFKAESKIRSLLTGWGFQETISYSMLSKTDLINLGFNPQKTIKISNPLTQEWAYMQSSLTANLLKNIRENQASKEIISLFEIGGVFDKKGKETRKLIIGRSDNNWEKLRGVVEQLLIALKVQNTTFAPQLHPILEKNSSTKILAAKEAVGYLGKVKVRILDKFELNSKVVMAEINLDKLIKKIIEAPPRFKLLAKHTPIIEDLSLQIPPEVNYQQVYELISSLLNIEKVEFIDHYQNRFAFRVFYQLSNRQISATEAQKIRQKLLDKLDKKLGVKLQKVEK
ncbi:phenylalanine--tRNA ligase subunit beta [Candidatus Shapirobacteria bacterium]|nr:phenylalanine--tRNA ligase subunit beta [Candidatus Shapirobacteria bacterium]